MEPYIAVDPVWGWVGTLYLGIPVLCFFALLVLGAVAAPHISTFRKKRALYPMLKIVHRGGRKKLFFTGSKRGPMSQGGGS